MKFGNLIGLAMAMLAGSAFGNDPDAPIRKALAKESVEVVSTYRQSGMAGLQQLSRRCFANEKRSWTECLFIDLGARYVDRMAGAGSTFPVNEYFGDSQFGPRVLPFFKGDGYSMEQANQLLSMLTPRMELAIDGEWQKPAKQSPAMKKCVDQRIARFRKAYGPERPINADVLQEWAGECEGPGSRSPR